MENKQDIIQWYKKCNSHKIIITQSNTTTGYSILALSNINNDIFQSFGETVDKALFDIKSMIEGEYLK